MLKWTGESHGRKIIGLGVEEKNLERLRAGDPIYIFGEEMGLPFDIAIYYGKDMNTLMAMTRPGIKPETVIHDTRERKRS